MEEAILLCYLLSSHCYLLNISLKCIEKVCILYAVKIYRRKYAFIASKGFP